MADILQGRNPPQPIPRQVTEFFLAVEFKWTLDYIRSLPYKDVDLLSSLVGVMYRLKGKEK